MDESTVLGGVSDALMQMPNFYGKNFAIGLLATGHEFRIRWIGEDV
jgi:hypothetical protein